MGSESRKDRLLAATASLVLAAMLGAVTAWLVVGLLATQTDWDRFDRPDRVGRNRAREHLSSAAMVMIPLAGVSGLGSLGLVTLGVWTLVSGRTER